MEERPWLKHYDPGVPHISTIPRSPSASSSMKRARKYPNQPCAIFKGGVVTYAEMNALTDRLAAALAAMGVKRGDPVGIFMPNIAAVRDGLLRHPEGRRGGGGHQSALHAARDRAPGERRRVRDHAGDEQLLRHRSRRSSPRPGCKTADRHQHQGVPAAPAALAVHPGQGEEGRAPGDAGRRAMSGCRTCWRSTSRQDRPKVDAGPEDVALFQYSGGTTGHLEGGRRAAPQPGRQHAADPRLDAGHCGRARRPC